MKVIIAGGRDFFHFEVLCSCCDYVLEDVASKGIAIISGCANGADALGERYAKLRDYALIRKPADWKHYGKRAGFLRNAEMAKIGDICICFWDGQSHDTADMIENAKKHGLQLFVFDYAGNYMPQ